MNISWTTLVSVTAPVLLGLLINVLGDEVRGRFDQLPQAILRLASRRLPSDVRADLTDEWTAELEAILQRSEGLPLTRLIAGLRYSSGLCRTAPLIAQELTGVASRALPLRAWAYISGVVALAVGLLSTSSFQGLEWGKLAALAILFLICDLLPRILNLRSGGISLAYVIILASVVLLGPAGSALIGLGVMLTRRQSLVKRLFNGALFILCCYGASTVFTALGGSRKSSGAMWLEGIALPFFGALFAFVTLNLALVYGVLLLSRQVTASGLLRESGNLATACFGYGAFGLLIATLWPELGTFSAALVLVPLLTTRWVLDQIPVHVQLHAFQRTSPQVSMLTLVHDAYRSILHGRERGTSVSPRQGPHQHPVADRSQWYHRRPSRSQFLISLWVVLSVASADIIYTTGFDQVRWALMFGGAIALGELLRVSGPGDRVMAPVATAFALSYALLPGASTESTAHSVSQVVLVTSAGTLLGSLLAGARSRSLPWVWMAARVVHVAIAALLFHALTTSEYVQEGPPTLTAIVGCALVYVVLDGLTTTFVALLGETQRVTAPVGRSRMTWIVSIVTSAGAVTIALGVSLTSLTTLTFFAMPMMATSFALRRYFRTSALDRT